MNDLPERIDALHLEPGDIVVLTGWDMDSPELPDIIAESTQHFVVYLPAGVTLHTSTRAELQDLLDHYDDHVAAGGS